MQQIDEKTHKKKNMKKKMCLCQRKTKILGEIITNLFCYIKGVFIEINECNSLERKIVA